MGGARRAAARATPREGVERARSARRAAPTLLVTEVVSDASVMFLCQFVFLACMTMYNSSTLSLSTDVNGTPRTVESLGHTILCKVVHIYIFLLYVCRGSPGKLKHIM